MGHIHINSSIKKSANDDSFDREIRSLSIEESRDTEKIKSLLFHDDMMKDLLSMDYRKDLKESEIFEALNQESMTYYLFYVDGNLAGFCGLFKNETRHPDMYFLVCDIGILKKYRGKIAQQLCEGLMEELKCKHKNIPLIALIDRKNKPSMFFCLSMGFKVLCKDDETYVLGSVLWAEP